MASSSATEAASAGPPVYVASPKREETPKQDGLVKQRYIDQGTLLLFFYFLKKPRFSCTKQRTY